MKVGIFSDVHGNIEALDAVLGFLRGRGATTFVCCGDIIGYGPNPAACIERVRSLRGPVVAGNHDYGVLGRAPLDQFNAVARSALVWTREQLEGQDLAYLESLPLTDQYGPFLLVHATPSSPGQWDYIFAVREAEEEMRYFSNPGCFIGHSHYPFVVERRPGEQARLVPASGVELRGDAKYVVNVGSVGQPRDGNPRACCVLYDTELRTVALHRVEYDIEKVQAKIIRAGLAEFLASRLGLGR